MDILDNEKPVWQSTTDLMSALMMLFLFIAVAFLYQLNQMKSVAHDPVVPVVPDQPMESVTPIAPAVVPTMTNAYSFEKDLNAVLHTEFDRSLSAWNAQLTDDNIIRFNANFKSGSSDVPEDFANIIDDFYPRYLKVLLPFKDNITELRIEGHTSNTWESAKRKEDIYINNMQLSQARASSVLKYVYLLDHAVIRDNQSLLERKLRANGMAFSSPIYARQTGWGMILDEDASRRVEFKVVSLILNHHP